MSLINCKECGHSISDKAKSCPSCGAAGKASSTSYVLATVAALGFGFAAALVAGVAFIMNGHDSMAVPGGIAFVVGAAVGWRRVMR
jgi:hypothetical protein